MTRPDAEALTAALEAATGRPWTTCVTGTGGLWLWPADGGGRVGAKLALVDCWPRSGRRKVVLRDGFGAPSVWRDVPQGRGWPARAAAAVVAMLGER
jgi:hypothetical protein